MRRPSRANRSTTSEFPLLPCPPGSAVSDCHHLLCSIIMSEAGRGAYGLVKRARRRGPDDEPVGPEVIIKMIIKARFGLCTFEIRILTLFTFVL